MNQTKQKLNIGLTLINFAHAVDGEGIILHWMGLFCLSARISQQPLIHLLKILTQNRVLLKDYPDPDFDAIFHLRIFLAHPNNH